MPGNLILKSINDLLGEQFIIPAYQRGFRWTERQVTDLLDDLCKFQPGSEKAFYCLQPIVVKKNEEQPEKWEVIDGQQRLTTLFIIIRFLAASLGIKTDEEYLKEFKKILYSIDYKTRPDSEGFLNNILEACDGDSNPDYFYMLNAFRTTQRWCEKLERGERDKLLDKIIGREDVKIKKYARCKVIWYEVDDQSDGPDLFTRLNIGKIPLKNSELVKALFLSRTGDDDSESHQGEIALLWDEMEQQLHQEGFWAFITNEKEEQYPNRIELLFDMISQKRSVADEYHTFLYFLEQLDQDQATTRWELWRKIEDHYQTLREWYHDGDLYHQIGYLVCAAGKKTESGILDELLEQSLLLKKYEFRKIIHERISRSLGKVGKNYSGQKPCGIDDLEYSSDHSLISNLLLLFNVESIRQNIHSTERYPFKSSKTGKWTLEHIHAQASDSLDANKSEVWKKWTEEHKKPLEELIAHYENKASSDEAIDATIANAKEILVKVDDFLKKPDAWTHEKFHEQLFQPIIKHFTESGEDIGDSIHGITNLALLKQGDNSAFSNAVFEVKRQRMLRADKEGSYIPVCTRRVFLKYYTENISDAHVFFWGRNDRDAYLAEMKRVLKQYLNALDIRENES